MAAVMICRDFGAQERKFVIVCIVSPSIYHEVMGPDAMILLFWRLSLSQLFHSPLSPSSLHFLPWGWCHLHIWGYWYFSQQSWFQLVLHPAQHFAWFTLSINIIAQSCPTLWIHGLHSPRNSPGQNTGVGSHSLLKGIFPTQGLNPGFPHCKQILYQLSHERSPRILEWLAYPFSSRSSWPRNRTRVSCIAGGFFTNWAIMKASDVLCI